MGRMCESLSLNFFLMLTERDVTIPDALEVYDSLEASPLRNIALKDTGVDRNLARELTERAHHDGRSVLLELADLSPRGQEEGIRLAIDLRVDRVVAGWRPEFADILAADGAPEYWPFVGSLSGSPLTLHSSPSELAVQSAELSTAHGVDGLVVMPYRQLRYDAVSLLESTAQTSCLPVLVAGGVQHPAQVNAIAAAGAWGFTVGGAALVDRHGDEMYVGRQVAEMLRLCQETRTPVHDARPERIS